MIVDGNKQAETLSELTGAFWDLLANSRDTQRPQLLPALDVLPYQHLSPHNEIAEQRAIGLWRLATRTPPITITPVASALLRTESRDFYRQLALTLRTGEEIALEDVTMHLESIGYQKREPVEMVGEYSLRGGILDVFPAEAERPVRIEFFGDEIESMRRFDVETQRSVLEVKDTLLLPLIEYPRSRSLFHDLAPYVDRNRAPVPGEEFAGWEFYVPMAHPRQESLLGMAKHAVVVWDEPEQVAAAAERLWKRLEDPERPHPVPAGSELLPLGGTVGRARRQRRRFRSANWRFCRPPGPHHCRSRRARPWPSTTTCRWRWRRAAPSSNRATAWCSSPLPPANSSGWRTSCRNTRVPFQLGLESADPTPPYLAERAYLAGPVASTYLVKGMVRRGTCLPRRRRSRSSAPRICSKPPTWSRAAGAEQVAAGGVRRPTSPTSSRATSWSTRSTASASFVGIREIAQGEQQGDFMLLEYAGEAKLYVPLTRMDLVQKYRGAGEGARRRSTGWAASPGPRTKIARQSEDARHGRRAAEALRRSASMAEGFAFSPDSNWQREFEDAFEFTPTKDQVTAVKDIKRDMESPQPMDRLLCGDVGFGKTEVAMRAAFKALGDGKQVAVLAPTTVLALPALRDLQAALRRRSRCASRCSAASASPKEIKAALEEIWRTAKWTS